MYTNIRTEPALKCIAEYIREVAREFNHLHCDALIDALHIVFRNNLFKLGDTFWCQTSGTAMGTPPAPAWATIFYALHEQNLVPRWCIRIPFYKRFIDDVIGTWLVNSDHRLNARLWKEFSADMNGWHGLKWDCEEPSSTINFMDMTIRIENGKLITSLYEKDMNLYLYIPPHSSHPRGVFSGLVFGQVLRIRRLCTHQHEANNHIQQFYQRLLDRGHTATNLLPLFRKAEANAKAYLNRSEAEREQLRKQKWIDSHNQVFFHLQYHPEDPRSSEIQSLWRELVSQPDNETPLPDLENCMGEKVGISRLVVAYSRPLNLRNRFTVREISGRGEPVSTYLAK